LALQLEPKCSAGSWFLSIPRWGWEGGEFVEFVGFVELLEFVEFVEIGRDWSRDTETDRD